MHEPATHPEDLGRFFVTRANAGDVEGFTRLDDGSTTAEVARRQPDGTWRWVLDQPRFAVPPAG